MNKKITDLAFVGSVGSFGAIGRIAGSPEYDSLSLPNHRQQCQRTKSGSRSSAKMASFESVFVVLHRVIPCTEIRCC